MRQFDDFRRRTTKERKREKEKERETQSNQSNKTDLVFPPSNIALVILNIFEVFVVDATITRIGY